MVYSNSFSDYKKTLEDLLQNISFLYSGDVISSEDRTMTMDVKHNSFSPELMKNVLLDIYNDSITKIIENSEEVSISTSNLKDIYQLMDMNTNSKYLFYSSNSNLNLNISSHLIVVIFPLTLVLLLKIVLMSMRYYLLINQYKV